MWKVTRPWLCQDLFSKMLKPGVDLQRTTMFQATPLGLQNLFHNSHLHTRSYFPICIYLLGPIRRGGYLDLVSQRRAASGPSQHATMRRAVSPLRIFTTPVNLSRRNYFSNARP